MKPILVVGSINMDYYVRLPRMPLPGESMEVGNFEKSQGGKGANQALALAKLDYPVKYIGIIGDDEEGEFLRKKLGQQGVNPGHLLTTTEAPTGTALILLDQDGENRIIVSRGANDKIRKQDLEPHLVPDKYAAVLVQLEIPLDVVAYIVETCTGYAMPTIVDAGPALRCDLKMFRDVTILSPNQTEIRALTGLNADTVEEAKTACEYLGRESGAQNIVLKMGKTGALIYADGEFDFVKAYGVSAVDTTGAGDSFTAALALGYAQGWGVRDCVIYANKAGALTVSKEGIYAAFPTKQELTDFEQDRV